MLDVSPSKDRAIQNVLNEEFERLRRKNPAYSLRAFARRLDLSPSALSELLQGKRGASRKLAEKIAAALLLAPDAKAQLLKEFPEKSTRTQTNRLLKNRKSMQLNMDHYRTISHWYHFAILSLAETQGFRPKTEWIARRLGLTKTVVAAALERLFRLEMIEKEGRTGFRATGLSYSTPDDIAELSLRTAHAGNLDLAKNSLERDAVTKRDFTSTTMAIDPAKLPEAKRRIRKFQNELCAFLESEEKKEVYKICIQLFPLSRSEGEDNV